MSEYSYEIVASRAEQPLDPGCTVLDGWEIVRKIGEGGQAKVYEIRSGGLTELRCALKVIDIPQSEAEMSALLEETASESQVQRELQEQVDRVQREVRAMAAIHDEPASVHLEDCRLYRFEEDGTWRVLIRMELLTPLPAYAKEHPLSPADVWRMAEEIGGLLAVCRQEGILHRDIKPANIFVTSRGHFKLGDFGLARAAGSFSSSMSHRVGTDAYMAPEVYTNLDDEDARYDHRADLYSLALVIYQYLNGGALPFEDEITTRRKAFLQRIKGAAVPAIKGLPDRQTAFFRTALAHDAEERFPTPEAFLAALSGKPKVDEDEQLRKLREELERKERELEEQKRRAAEAERRQREQEARKQRKAEEQRQREAEEQKQREAEEQRREKAEARQRLEAEHQTVYRDAVQRLSAAKTLPELREIRQIFLDLGEFRDAEEWAATCEERIRKMEAADSPAPPVESVPKPLNRGIQPGSTLTFGRYPQDTDGTVRPIEWQVLEVKDEKALLISKHGLDAKKYNEKFEKTTWEKCTLRTWLNQDFMQTAFNPEEAASILLTDVDNGASQGYSKYKGGGNNTRDRIFLLSYAEANRYFGVTWDDAKNVKARVAPTAFAIKNGTRGNDGYKTADQRAADDWWLRSPGFFQRNAAYVRADGSLYNFFVNYTASVRPVLWADLKSLQSLAGDVDTDSNLKAGSILTFGHYAQEFGSSTQPIAWQVLEVQEGRALLISRDGLEARTYNGSRVDVTWESCALRTWLNSTFLQAAFTVKEQASILMTEVNNDESQGCSAFKASGGNNTQDKLFLLSCAEAGRYFGVTQGDRNRTKPRVAPCRWAIKNGAHTSETFLTEDGKPAGWWWLRSPGNSQSFAAYVSYDGSLYSASVDSSSGCVRPAMWINTVSGTLSYVLLTEPESASKG